MTNVLVNPNKSKRAQDILDFIDGKIKTSEESVLADKMKTLIDEEEVENGDRLEFIYTKLGGLVRTPVEQSKAELKAAKIEAEFQKKEAAKVAKAAKKEDED